MVDADLLLGCAVSKRESRVKDGDAPPSFPKKEGKIGRRRQSLAAGNEVANLVTFKNNIGLGLPFLKIISLRRHFSDIRNVWGKITLEPLVSIQIFL